MLSGDEIIRFRFYQNRKDTSGIWVPMNERFPRHADPKDWYLAGIRTLTRREHAEGRLNEFKRG